MIAKHIPAVLVGAVIASAAFLLLDRSGDDIDPASIEMTNSNAESQAIGARGEQLPSDSGERDLPVNGMVQSSDLPKDAGEDSSRRNGAAPDAALSPPDLPIYLPREFDWLRVGDYFGRFERKPIDHNWSPQAKIQLSNYFYRHPELTNIYGMPTIHCRATECMALFIAHGYLDHGRNHPDPALAKNAETQFVGPTEIFKADNRGFFNDPVAKQFSDKDGVMAEGRLQNGVAAFFWLLPRRTADN